jgi:putative photosynthetic complex assembly protein 2
LSVLGPVLSTILAWWLSTGVILYLDGLPKRTFPWSLLGASVLAVAALAGLKASSTDASVTGAYCAFSSGLMIWAWLEITFYMGFLTGPRKHRCKPGCAGWRHFRHAVAVSLYHELAIFVAAALTLVLTWRGVNQVGTWTFITLWWMHQSARLNVFLGVRNLNENFLPEHLDFLKSFLTEKPMNLLFPVSVTVSTGAAVLLVQRAAAAGTPFEATGLTIVATLMSLAILEHWLLVLPISLSGLWNWSLKSRQAGHGAVCHGAGRSPLDPLAHAEGLSGTFPHAGHGRGPRASTIARLRTPCAGTSDRLLAVQSAADARLSSAAGSSIDRRQT